MYKKSGKLQKVWAPKSRFLCQQRELQYDVKINEYVKQDWRTNNITDKLLDERSTQTQQIKISVLLFFIFYYTFRSYILTIIRHIKHKYRKVLHLSFFCLMLVNMHDRNMQ
jgi:hypothetical protein